MSDAFNRIRSDVGRFTSKKILKLYCFAFFHCFCLKVNTLKTKQQLLFASLTTRAMQHHLTQVDSKIKVFSFLFRCFFVIFFFVAIDKITVHWVQAPKRQVKKKTAKQPLVHSIRIHIVEAGTDHDRLRYTKLKKIFFPIHRMDGPAAALARHLRELKRAYVYCEIYSINIFDNVFLPVFAHHPRETI